MQLGRWSRLAPLVGAAFLSGCAYVGPPMPPSPMIPMPIVDLGVVERGEKLVFDFTVPKISTDGVALRTIDAVDLRIGRDSAAWASESRTLETGDTAPGPVHFEVPAKEWIGQQIMVRVRTAGKHGHFSDWSNAVRLNVLPPLATPDLKAQASAQGVSLTWAPENGSGFGYRVFKLGPGDQKAAVVATVKEPEYSDTLAQYGKPYQYAVQAFVKSADSEVQSDLTEPVSITPEDKFPPAVPSNVAAITGTSSINLSWTPDSEPDLRGYYVYRAVDDGPFQRIGDLLQSPAYSDQAVEGGKRYRYAVSAVDQRGNESDRSAAVEAAAP